jgi:hypothetical protein
VDQETVARFRILHEMNRLFSFRSHAASYHDGTKRQHQ